MYWYTGRHIVPAGIKGGGGVRGQRNGGDKVPMGVTQHDAATAVGVVVEQGHTLLSRFSFADNRRKGTTTN